MTFISYSRKDSHLVLPLVKLLRVAGQTVFLDLDDLDYGKDWRLQLSTVIGQSDRFLVFWSNSSQLSEVVTEEWKQALQTPHCRIIPVMLDKTPLPNLLAPFHGTSDLAPLFTQLKKGKAFRRTLWVSALIFAALAAIIIGYFPAGQSGGDDDVNHGTIVVIAFFIASMVAGIIILLPYLISSNKQRSLYHKAKDGILR